MLFPIVGALLYIVIGGNLHKSKVLKAIKQSEEKGNKYFIQDEKIKKEIESQNNGKINYLMNYLNFPVTKNNNINYYKLGELAYPEMLKELKNAKKFIFLEYFIIKNGTMWSEILKILEEKAKEGLDVRLIYDDMGCIALLPTSYPKQMKEKGIKCIAFNKLNPFLGVIMNNRDHRKITVIDGKIGFTGGYNLANEYFGFSHPYGEWKDTGIRLEGDAVRSLTITFLEMWNAIKKNLPSDRSFEPYKAVQHGYVQPYADSPLDDEQVGEEVYISMANKAEHYCWFITPYLIITDELSHALSLAAKRGVDVRIITPGIPDKKMVYSVTRSFYHQLVSSGVHIFEWTPGFCHAKMSIADDRMATCGTINLDYRSLYHHFENGCFMVDCPAVMDIKHDFRHTFSQCRDVTEKYKTGLGAHLRLGQLILRLFAQLL